jgi:membrane-associated phospholipid phosphatase/tRNA A-37 threonylcarbamoyl transferase component Bud32
LLQQIARARTSWLTDVMTAIDRICTGWTVTVMAVGVIALQMVFRRWRHLFTFLGSVAILVFVGGQVYDGYHRPRPYDVEIIGRWAGYAMPSPPVAVLATILLGIAYTLVVPGRPRGIAKFAIAAVLVVFAAARLYLAVDHPFDVLVGAALGVAIPLNAFRLFTPNDMIPVNYRRAKTAHLDVGGRRGEAIRRAVRDQLGLTVVEAEPVGLEGSGGSTPLRLRVAGDPDTYLFGKLYAMSHVRADRWYKLGRTLLYGRLEDEAPFQSVRRLVEYEDYAFRLLRDAGIPTAAPYGIVEITPDREYLLVTEFLGGAPEISRVDIDDGIIDEGLSLIRRLWDAGLAHRDIKPANLLARDGKVLLVDAFFVQVRPSPWRQAVDLANMMLVLAVGSDAERVYRRALEFFTPDEIAEAFAAARGVASPTQLRVAMKRDGRNLLGQFRALAPERPPISLQRWGLRRVGLAIALVIASVFAVSQTVLLLKPAHDIALSGTPHCGTDNLMVLIAQSVPSATSVPCIATLPAGWELGDVHVKRHWASFSLDSDRGGDGAVRATLMPREDCDLSAATPVPSDEQGMRRYEEPERLPPNLRATRYYVFSGGCVTYEFAFDGDAGASLLFDADNALAFQPRETLVDEVRERSGLRLCGAGARCPG